MQFGTLAFTAVFLKAKHGYGGFIEELPNVNAHGHTIEEARSTLQKLAVLVFDEERRSAPELPAGKKVGREAVLIPLGAAWPAPCGGFPAGGRVGAESGA